MKVKKFLILFIVFFISLISLFASPKNNKPRYISVEEIALKNKPSFWGAEGDSLYYGDVVYVIDMKDSWLKVESTSSGKKGWVKDSVVTSRKIVSKNKISVDAKEIALAGKGFSSPLEAEYSDLYNINFDIVDKIEKITISDKDIRDFIISGQLRGEE